MSERLRAPFPWFGGKSRVAHLVWDRFGDVPNYVEPFAGSLAVLLGRPHRARIETVNDKDAYIANFWRAVTLAPEETAWWADWPINEADLHARHAWLVDQTDFKERILGDPDYFSPKIAGWWVWGICQWIGSGWCERPDWRGRTNAGRAPKGIHHKMPLIGERGGGRGVLSPGLDKKRPQLGRGFRGDVGGKAIALHQTRPNLSGNSGASGMGIHASGLTQQMPNLSGDSGAAGRGIHASGSETPTEQWFAALQERLRFVRVCCGDWKRVMGPSPTVKIGTTAVFLDPPYDMRVVSDKKSGRDGNTPTDKLYSHHCNDISSEVRAWALANGDNPELRIALCGYEGEHEMPESWTCVAWKANGGYGNQRGEDGKANARRERIWFSPHCLKIGLFEQLYMQEESAS